ELLHSKDASGDTPFGRRRVPADVRRPQRLSLRLRPILCDRLCADGKRAGRTPADRRLSDSTPRRDTVVYFRPAYDYICCMMITSPSSSALDRLRAAGLRPTRQRLALARLLLGNA